MEQAGDSGPMIFGFGRKSRFRTQLKELQVRMQDTITDFAVGVTEDFDPIVNRRTVGPPAYPLFFSIGPPKTDKTHLNQLILCLDALSFFVHALDRFLFRPDSEALSAAVLEATVLELENWLESTVANLTASETLVSKNELRKYIDHRASQYIHATSLLGTGENDRHTAIWLAAKTTARDAGYPNDVLLTKLIQTRLFEGLADLDLAERVKKLEQLL
jgi:hypothetical protein